MVKDILFVSRKTLPLSVQQQIDQAVKRASGCRTRSTSVAADEFLYDWLHASTQEKCDTLWELLPERLDRLVRRLDVIERGDTNCRDTYNNHVETLFATVFSRAPQSMLLSFRHLFSKALLSRQKQWEANDPVESDGYERNDKDETTSMVEEISTLHFDEEKLYQNLRRLGWISTFSAVNKVLMQAVQEVLSQTLTKIIHGEYNSFGIWDSVSIWKNKVLKPWLIESVLGCGERDLKVSEESRVPMCNISTSAKKVDPDDWGKTIDFAVAEVFVNVRSQEIFDIVTDFPDSLPAVEELRGALAYTTHLHKMRLATCLRDSLQRRLLHPGANTIQILDVYINAVKVCAMIMWWTMREFILS
jgi:hypothetical protein